MRKIIRKKQVEEVVGFSGRTVDRYEEAGNFPKRVQIGLRSVGWYEDEILKWLDERSRGALDEPKHLARSA